jgi:hypothetical protein
MAFAHQHAVLLMVGVEVRACGRKGLVASTYLMQVNRMLTRLHVLKGELDEQAAAGLHQVGGSDEIAFLILDLRMSREALFGANRWRKSREQNARADKFHSNQRIHHGPPFGASISMNP